MKYTVRNGLVYKDILGEHVIAAVGEARRVCPSVILLNDAGAFYWSLLERHMEEDALLDACAKHFGADREEARQSLYRFMSRLAEKGYITFSEQED